MKSQIDCCPPEVYCPKQSPVGLSVALETARASSRASYEQAARLHLMPRIGKVPLARLTPAQFETWFAEHRAAGASTRSIRYARTVLGAALHQAKRWNMVGTNAAALIDPSRHQPKEIQPLTPEQARAASGGGRSSARRVGLCRDRERPPAWTSSAARCGFRWR
jgi:hypothetical protein